MYQQTLKNVYFRLLNKTDEREIFKMTFFCKKKKKKYNEALYACKARAFPYKNAPIQHVAQLALLQR